MKSVIVGYKVQKLLEGKNKDPSLVMYLCNMQPNRVHNIHLTTLQTLSFKGSVTISTELGSYKLLTPHSFKLRITTFLNCVLKRQNT